MRQNGFLLNTKIVQDALLNPKRAATLPPPISDLSFQFYFFNGSLKWMKRCSWRYNEGWRGGMIQSHQWIMAPPLTKAFMRPILIARLLDQELRKSSQCCNGTLSSVHTKWGKCQKGLNSIINFIPLRRGESPAL